MKDKLAGWKTRCLSCAGRLTLAQSVLSNMAAFHMQLQRLPTRIHNELDKAIDNGIWGSSISNKKVHLRNRDILCRPIVCGGAGPRNRMEF